MREDVLIETSVTPSCSACAGAQLKHGKKFCAVNLWKYYGFQNQYNYFLGDETKQALPAVSSLSSRPLSPETPMYQSAPSWMTNVCNAMASPAGGGSSLSTPSTSTGSQPNSLIKPPEPTRSAASNAQVIHPSPGSLVDLKNIKLTVSAGCVFLRRAFESVWGLDWQKDQQRSITEIFASANRVTRTEKILIINFIVGQRGKYSWAIKVPSIVLCIERLAKVGRTSG